MRWEYPLVEIRDLVRSVKKWNPRQSKTNELINYIDISSIDRETKEVEHIIKVSAHEAPSRARQLVVKGDVLVSTVRPNLNAVAHLEVEHDRATASTGFTVLRSNPQKLYNRYLYYWVRSSYFIQDMIGRSTGASYPAISDSIVKAYKIPLPPLEEQKRIAEILDKADAIRSKRKEAIRLTEELLRSTFLDMFGDVSSMKKVRLKKLASADKYALSSGPFGSNLTSAHYVEEGVIVLRGKNVTAGKLDFSDLKYISEQKAIELARSLIATNDIVVVAVGASGKAFLIPEELPYAVMSQNFNKITPDTNKVSPIYLTHSLNSTFVQNQLAKNITDTVRTFLSLTKLKEVIIPLPDLEKQKKFADFVQKIEKTRNKNLILIQESTDLFNSLLQKAFRGEL